MSFTPRLSAEDFESLYRLYRKAFTQSGVSPKNAATLQIELREQLQALWNATDPKPINMNFEDFRRAMMQRFLDRSGSEDPRYPSI
jgi:hypothetical protein